MRDAEEFEYVFPCLRHRNYWSHGVGAVPMSVLSVGFIVVVLYCRRALLSSCFTVVVLYCRRALLSSCFIVVGFVVCGCLLPTYSSMSEIAVC